MDAKRFVLGTLVGGVSLFATGTLLFSIPTGPGFLGIRDERRVSDGCSARAATHLAVALGAVSYGALIALAIGCLADSLKMGSGIKTGAVVGFLLWRSRRFGTVDTYRDSPKRRGWCRASPLMGLSEHGPLKGASRSHVRLLGTSQFARPRPLGAQERSRTLGRHRRFRLRGFVCGVDLPLVRAVHAGIDQRSANVVVEPFAVGLTDWTFYDGRGYGSHRRCTFLH